VVNESQIVEIAKKAALAAAEIHLRYFNTDLQIETKSTHYDLRTVADIESEKLIVSIIQETFPDHNIIAEENKYLQTSSEYTWIIDPLDGTSNFAHRFPIFSVSIALAYKGSVILGAVCDPTRKELFFGLKGAGAFLNDKRILVTKNQSLKQAILITGFYYDRGDKMIRALDDMKSFLLAGIVGIRRLGSAALDLCNVASGRADGYWEFKLNPWDFAAGKLIVEEAGGKVTDNSGEKVGIAPSYIVASNGLLHETLLDVLR
jgi:myo-inositol-1(or 4)-monophosphatase